MAVYLIGPPENPLARWLAAILAVLVVAGLFAFGMVVLLVLLAVGGLLAIVWAARSLWFRLSGKPDPLRPQVRTAQAETLEAEYRVVSRRQD